MREPADIGAPVGFVVPRHRLHRIGLTERTQQGAADRGIVERRLQVVQDERAGLAERVVFPDGDVAVLREARQQVENRPLPPIHLARLQGGERGARVGDDVPLHPVDIDDFRPGTLRNAAASPGHVGVELLVDIVVPGDRLVRQEPERPAADHLGHDGRGRRRGQALGHDRQYVRLHLAQRQRQEREGLPQAKADGAVVRRRQLVRPLHQSLSQTIDAGPAPDAGHGIAGEHGRAIVEPQPRPQRQIPLAAIGIRAVALDHLWLDIERRVHAVEGVEHHVGVVQGNLGWGTDRVAHRQVTQGNEAHHAAALRTRPAWQGKWCSSRRCQQGPALHGGPPGGQNASKYSRCSQSVTWDRKRPISCRFMAR